MKGKTKVETPAGGENKGEIVLYQPEGSIQLPVRILNDTVWLTIEQMALLFGKSRSTVNEHILNAISEGEISKDESMRKIGNSDFSTKPTNFYNLKLLSTDLCDSVSHIRIDFCILSPTPERVLLEDRYPRKRGGLFCFERGENERND